MSYEHKDTPESWWDRMRLIHGDDYNPPVQGGIEYCSHACAQEQECCMDTCPFDDELATVNKT